MNKNTEEDFKSSHLKYRPDIDGLRAIAVLAVVFYHAFPKKLVGGFIGVDIFFIISGFLISTILFNNLKINSFSIVDFYRRRINRIFPALLLVLISCLVFGWFFLLSDEYRQLGKHTAGGAGFISNIMLWGESGYFDASADSKPLLHLWSLAVEEQFYIFWPLILAIIWRKKWNFIAIIALAAASFFINLYYLGFNATAAFYSPLSRFWELMLGSMLAYILLFTPQYVSKYKNFQSALGLFLLLVGFIFINSERQFPGWWAMLPTFGAVFIIAAGPEAYFNKKILSSRLFVWFGLISYPLYLWHWPVFSFLHMVFSINPSKEIKILAILMSIFLAWLTYYFIEKTLRKKTSNSKNYIISFPVIMIMVGVIGYVVYDKNGLDGTGYRLAGKSAYSKYFDNTYPEWHYMKSQGMVEKYREDCNFYDIEKFIIGKNSNIPRTSIGASCYQRDEKYSKSVFIWGDSHGAQLYYGLKNNLSSNWQIMQVTSSACPPTFNAKLPSNTNYCEQSNWFAAQAIKHAKPDVVIISQYTGHSIANFDFISKNLKNMGVKRIIFTGPVPHWKNDLSRIILRSLWNKTPRETFIGLDENIIKENINLKSNFKYSDGVIYADLIGKLCGVNGCTTYFGDDRKNGLTTWDTGHFTPITSDYVAKELLVGLITATD